MSTTVMSVKTEKVIKEQAQKLAKQMGFPLGTLINAFLRQFIRDKSINFSMETTEVMTAKLEKKLEKIEKDIKNNKNISTVFANSDDLINCLDNSNI